MTTRTLAVTETVSNRRKNACRNRTVDVARIVYDIFVRHLGVLLGSIADRKRAQGFAAVSRRRHHPPAGVVADRPIDTSPCSFEAFVLSVIVIPRPRMRNQICDRDELPVPTCSEWYGFEYATFECSVSKSRQGQLAPSTPQELPDEARLTQYGERSPVGSGFRDRLRTEIGETEMSMILGEVDVTAAAVLITKHLAPGAERRVTTVGRLRYAGFVVIHSPTRGNPLHVSVYAPRDEKSAEHVEWTHKVARRFNACFTEDKSSGGRRRQ